MSKGCPIHRKLHIEELECRAAPALITVLNLSDAGAGSLRQAIIDANSTPTIPDDIVFDPALFPGPMQTINLTGGKMDITSELTITGPGDDQLTIDAGGSSQIFGVNDGSDDNIQVGISNLTLTNGSVGADQFGGAIRNWEDLMVGSCTISDSDAGYGGGIAITGLGTLVLTKSLVTGNEVVVDGGGIFMETVPPSPVTGLTIQGSTISLNQAGGLGGGIACTGSPTEITSSTIDGNTASEGGGIYSTVTALTITESTISSNTATASGAGIHKEMGTLTMTDSTVSENIGLGNADGGGIYNAGTLTMTGSTVSLNDLDEGDGGGIYNTGTMTITDSTISENEGNDTLGGGIYNEGTLTITGSSVSYNQSPNFNGGGIYNDYYASGPVTITGSTISHNNVVYNVGGGICYFSSQPLTIINSTISNNIGDGGGIYIADDPVVTITDSTISGNTKSGIFNRDGTLTITNSTVSHNFALSEGDMGGGICNFEWGAVTIINSTVSENFAPYGGGIYSGSEGTVTIENTTISANDAIAGGGIYAETGTTVTVTNSTISGNTADEDGGGIFEGSHDGTVYLYNSTVANNIADADDDGSGDGGGIHAGAAVLVSTIVADNVDAGGEANDVSGTVTSNGHNLVGDGSGSSGWVASDLVGTAGSPIDPLLDPLADNGGPTLTHALLPGSPAINAGSNPQGLLYDQRGPGYPREYGSTDVGAIESPGTLIIDADDPGGNGSNNGIPDYFLLVRNGDVLEVYIDGNFSESFPYASFTDVIVRGSNDDDTLTLDFAGGSPLPDLGLTYDGDGEGPGGDTLILMGGPAGESTYSFSGPGAGTIDVDGLGISYTGLEPIVDLVPAVMLTVNGTNADNAINYMQSPIDPAWGLVSVDGFETIEFANKETLVINGLAGSDEINLNNPSVPDGLMSIMVDGGDPTASDKLIFNGRPGVEDSIAVVPLGPGSGMVGYYPEIPVVNFTRIEDLSIVGQLDDYDELLVEGTEGSDLFEYFEGAEIGSGTIIGTMDGDGDPFSLVPVSFTGINPLFDTVAFNVIDPDGEDVLIYNGTPGDDYIEVVGGASINIVNYLAGEVPRSHVYAENMIYLIVRGYEGDDSFYVYGNDETAVLVEGGSASGHTNVLNYFALGDVTVELDLSTIWDTATSAPVSYSGIDVINVQAYGNNLGVKATDAYDTIRVRPAVLESATVEVAGQPVVNGMGVDVFTVNAGDGGGTVIVEGNGEPNTIYVADAWVDILGLEPIFLLGETALFVEAGQGDDMISVMPSYDVPIVINGSDGDDAVEVNASNLDLPGPHGAVTFNGGGGYDRLMVVGTPSSGPVGDVAYTPGPAAGAGRLDYNNGDFVINFTGLEPLVDLVPALTLTVNGTNADNAINYMQSPNVLEWGLVSVDGFETIEFANKETLLINGLAGSDEININNPSVPDGLMSIMVDGGDPTASDTLIVNGQPGEFDAMIVLPLGPGTGIVTYDAGFLPDVFFTEMEHLSLVGQLDDGDVVGVEGTPGSDLFEYFEGAEIGSGTILGTMNVNDGDGGMFSLIPISFSGINPLYDTVVFNVLSEAAGEDALIYNGTPGDDYIEVIGSASLDIVNYLAGEVPRSHVYAENIFSLIVRGYEGDDSFYVYGNDETAVLVEGGSASGHTNVLNYVALGDVTVELDLSTIWDTATSAPVSYSGIDVINVQAYGNNLGVKATDAYDTIRVRPAVLESATVEVAGQPVVNGMGVDEFTVNAGDGGGTVIVEGNGEPNTINVADAWVYILGLEPIFLLGETALFVEAGQGDDMIYVLPSYDVPIVINGSDGDDAVFVDVVSLDLPGPHGAVTFNGGGGYDRLMVVNMPSSGPVGDVAYTPGPAAGAGRLDYNNGDFVINFTGLEPIVDLVPAATLTVNGTNADNAINYMQSPNDPAWGLVSVDGFESIEFANKETLLIDGLAGSDEINLNNPTIPIGLIDIFVDGGDPTASDTLIVNGRPGEFDAMIVLPLGPGAGIVTYDAGFLPDVFFTEVEHLSLVGQLDDGDVVGVEGTPGSDLFEYFEGAEIGSGTILGTMNVDDGDGGTFSLVPISFSGINPLYDTVVFNVLLEPAGEDVLIYHGTPGDDYIEVLGGFSINIFNYLAGMVPRSHVYAENIFYLIVRGYEGDDSFYVYGNDETAILVEGGSASAHTNVLNYFALGDVMVELDLSTIWDAAAAPVYYSGIDVINVDANNNDLTVRATDGDDTVRVRPTDDDAATVEVSGQPVVNGTELVPTPTFTVDAGGGNDTVIVEGNQLANMIGVTDALVIVDGLIPVNLLNEEALSIEAGEGIDFITVIPSDTVQIFVDGGDPIGQLQQPGGDILNVIAGGSPYVYEPGPERDEGRVTVAGTQPVSFDHIELLLINDIPYILPDEFEPNDAIAEATVLGSLPKITLRDLTLHDEGAGVINEDFFQITAQDTGKLLITAYFLDEGELGLGDVDIQVQDQFGNVIIGSYSVTDNEHVAFPVVSQERYFLRVYSADSLPNSYELEIENFAAPMPTEVDLDPASDSGVSNTDDLTNVTTPTVFVEADLAEFEAEGIPIDPEEPGSPGADVQVQVIETVGGTVIATLNATRLDGGPLWTATLPALAPDGLYYVKAAVTITDGQGTPVTGRTQLCEPLQLTIDTTAPAAPTSLDLDPSSDTGRFDDDNVTKDSTPLFTVHGNTDTYWRIYRSASGVGVYTLQSTPPILGSDGNPYKTGVYEELPTQADGVWDYVTRAVDAAGNESGNSPVLVVTIDTTAPDAPISADLQASSDSGISNSDWITNDNTPGFDIFPTIGGPGGPGDYVRMYDASTSELVSGMWHAIENVGGTSIGKIELPAQSDGVHGYAAVTVDLAGNESLGAIVMQGIRIDTIAPDVTAGPATITLDPSSDTGAPGDGITNDNTPTFDVHGVIDPAEAGTLFFRIYREFHYLVSARPILGDDGGIYKELDPPPPPGEGSETVHVQPDGAHVYTVRIVDEAGNESGDSEALELIIDTVAPGDPSRGPDLRNGDPTVVPDPLASDTGIYDDDNLTRINTPTIDVYDGSGNYIWLFRQNPGSIIPIQLTSGFVGTIAPYSYTDTPPLPDGTYIYFTRAVDAAGNVSSDSPALEIKIDTTPPPAPSSLDLSPLADTGRFDDDNITMDVTPLFTVHGNTDDYWRIYRSDTGAGVYSLVSTPPILGDDGGVYKNEPWEELSVQQPDGTYDYITRAVDGAGNVSPDSPILTVTINTSPPSIPSAPDLQASSDTGISNTDDITKDNTPGFDILPVQDPDPEVRGDYVRIYDLNTGLLKSDLWNAIEYDPILGLWIGKVELSAQFDGAHDYVATVVDAAGNETAFSGPIQVIIDTTLPDVSSAMLDLQAASDSGIQNDDDYTNDNTPTFDVTGVVDILEPYGLSTYYRIYRDFSLLVSRQPTLGDDGGIYRAVVAGAGSETLGEQDDGLYIYSVRLVDTAGNESGDSFVAGPGPGGASGQLAVTIDTTLPAPPPGFDGTINVPSLDLRDGDPAITGDPFSSDTGVYADDNVTRVNTPTFDAVLLEQIPPHGGVTQWWRIYRTYDGNPTPVLVSDPAGGGTIGADGWIYNPSTMRSEQIGIGISGPEPDNILDHGPGLPWLYTMRTVDRAGNESGNGPGLYVWIDTVAPDLSGGSAAIALTPESDSGIFDDDDVTNDPTPTFEVTNISSSPGTEDQALYFRIFRDDAPGGIPIGSPAPVSAAPIFGSDTSVYKELDEPPQPPTPPGAPVTTGHETLLDQQDPPGTPGEYVYAYSVSAVDRAGNISTPSDNLIVTIDTTTPDAPNAPDLDASTDSGIWDDDNYTNFVRPRFNVTVQNESEDYWQIWRLDPDGTLHLVSEPPLLGPDGQVYRGSGDPYAFPWPPGSGYEILGTDQPDSVDQFGRPTPYIYSAVALNLAGNMSDFSAGTPVVIDTLAPPTMTLSSLPLDYIPGTTEPIHTNWPEFDWSAEAIPSGPPPGGTYDPATMDCYLATYWIGIDGVDEHDTRYQTASRPLPPPPPPIYQNPGIPPHIPQDDPGTNYPAPDSVYELSKGGSYGNWGLGYGFHSWSIRAEDLAGNKAPYSNSKTFLIDVFTEADGDIIRLDVDRWTLANAGLNPVLTVTSTTGGRPGTDYIQSIDIANTDEASLLHFYIDPANPNEPAIGPGDGMFNVGDVASGPDVSVGMISMGIPKDYTPTATSWTNEGTGTFDTVDIGGSRLGALLISGDYDASAGQWVMVGGGTGQLGWFRARNITLSAPGGHSGIFTGNTKFISAPRGHIWDSFGVPLSPTVITTPTTYADDGGGTVKLFPLGRSLEVITVPMPNGGVVIAEVNLPMARSQMSALPDAVGGDITHVVSTGGSINKLNFFTMSYSYQGEIDVLSIDSMGGNISQVFNTTYGGDIFHIDAHNSDIKFISIRDSGRLGIIYAGQDGARRVWPRHDPWPPTQDPPVYVPLGTGEDYFRENGVIADDVRHIKVGRLDGANINLTGQLRRTYVIGGTRDTQVTAASINSMYFKQAVENSTFTTTDGNLKNFTARDGIADSTITVAAQLSTLKSFGGMVDTTVMCNSLRNLSSDGLFNGNTVIVTNNVTSFYTNGLFDQSTIMVGGNVRQFRALASVRNSTVSIAGSVQRFEVNQGLNSSALNIGGNMPYLIIRDGMSGGTPAAWNVINVGGEFGKGYIYGDISQYSRLVVGGPPPVGRESSVRDLRVFGLIYGEIEVYGNLRSLMQAGAPPTPAPPQPGFVEAFFFNDQFGNPTGGRLDVGGTTIRLF